ncbi:MAG TPA: TCR/Tet family MFS transporter [Saprospiraceae bacterium]|mgnify:FL=1|nr:TCR/Tet family MFS transporter [Lewinellaceae bacterium]HPQ97913.1 TCR/Tet family MFS transporter [Saprospiraceae bacterium]HRV85439.1 TCR/Tet family MFS transporter [Saprospiraceae bacterium]
MKNRKAAIGFIFVTLLIDVIGFGIIIPVLPSLISSMLDIPVNEASRYGGMLTAMYAVMQFIFAPILGNLSDKYGRRPVLLISLFGFFLDYLILGFAPSFYWLFVGRTLAGITGASFTTAAAYIADISTKENRANNFGMIGAAFGLGFILGPALGGWLGELGTRVPFFAAAGLTLINWMYGYFVLPESLGKENRRDFDWKRANPFGAIAHLRKYPSISGLFISFALVYIGAHAVQSNWSYYTMYRFSWSEGMVGLSLALVGLLVGAVQGGLIRVINPVLGDTRSSYVGLLLYALGLALFGFAFKSWMMYAFLLPYCLGGIAGPALQSIITSQVPPNAQGELQGALTSLISVTSIIGPPLMTGLFTYATSANAPFHVPGLPFFLGSVFMLISALIAYRTLHRKEI